eukprot:m.22122 g.22122  ORF g.22122 m.22122 type:complete len:751 (+) comp8806_c0_seq1:27-2279(+)
MFGAVSRSLFRSVRTPAAVRVASASTQAFKNISYEVEDGIAVVTFDQQDSKVNTLNMDMSYEFGELVKQLENNSSIRGAVILSGKKNNFIAGADINMFTKCKTSEEMEAISRNAHPLFDALEGGKPIVAAIEGSCMGGGLELALACHYRIASSNPKTVFSLPEVMLGLLPGAGGTQRLPKLIGLQAALPIILTGKNVRPKQAQRMKLVDSVADPSALRSAAVQAAKGLADGTLKVNREPKGMKKLIAQVLEGTEFGRNFMFDQARKMVMKQTKGVYPAPLKIIDVLKESATKGFGSTAGFKAEAKAFGDLGITPESKALVTIYFGQTACKKNPFGTPQKKDNNIAVLGAGLMGAGITEVTVSKGANVVLKDATQEGLARGIDRVYNNLNKKTRKRRMTTFERDQTMSRILGLSNTDSNWQQHFGHTDMVIEAVFEDLTLKHNIIREIEAITPEDCVFATNTSAIPITKLAEASTRPQNFIGMHYFSPVEKMPLLEIIRHPGTSDETAARAFAMGLRQGKTPVFVKDVPGFYVNRSLGPYSDEGLALLLDGAKIDQVDNALLKFGFPVGPMTLVDEVGIDVAVSVGKTLKDDLGVRIGTADETLMQTVVERGMLGRKSGKGMHIFPKNGKKSVNPEMVELIEELRAEHNNPSSGLTSTQDIQMRMATRFINETAHCLQDEIVDNPVVGDIAAVFGIGFPPFRGGPFRYLDAYGVGNFVDVMYKYRDQLGPQFEPAQILKDYAKTGRKFHNE